MTTLGDAVVNIKQDSNGFESIQRPTRSSQKVLNGNVLRALVPVASGVAQHAMVEFLLIDLADGVVEQVRSHESKCYRAQQGGQKGQILEHGSLEISLLGAGLAVCDVVEFRQVTGGAAK